MRYTVLRIDEDIDCGCEERAADASMKNVMTREVILIEYIEMQRTITSKISIA